MAAATTTIESSTPCSEGLGFDSTQTVPPTPSTVSEDTPMEHDAAAESERAKDNVPRLSTEHEEKRESTTLQPLPGPAITEVRKNITRYVHTLSLWYPYDLTMSYEGGYCPNPNSFNDLILSI